MGLHGLLQGYFHPVLDSFSTSAYLGSDILFSVPTSGVAIKQLRRVREIVEPSSIYDIAIDPIVKVLSKSAFVPKTQARECTCSQKIAARVQSPVISNNHN
jgi:hypothetical protein